MKRTMWMVLILSGVFAAQGCGTAAGELIGAARGGSGTFTELSRVGGEGERPLGAYKRFELEQIEDDFANKVPPRLWGLLPGEFDKALKSKKLPNEPGGKALLVQGKVLHYEDSSTLGILLGDVEEVVARIELVDKDTGNVLGVANCVGRTKHRTNRGVGTKAEGLAEAIVGWIDSRYPKEGR